MVAQDALDLCTLHWKQVLSHACHVALVVCINRCISQSLVPNGQPVLFTLLSPVAAVADTLEGLTGLLLLLLCCRRHVLPNSASYAGNALSDRHCF